MKKIVILILIGFNGGRGVDDFEFIEMGEGMRKMRGVHLKIGE